MPSKRETPHQMTLAGAAWLVAPETAAVLAAIINGGFSARVVGGAVRNGLLGRQVKDIDIATTATPEDVSSLAERAGLKAVPTGAAHGTVTVIAGHRPFEVTTLRRDVETDGRHARVAFTTDWVEDARRRDFTINALYCDREGIIHDPLGGMDDLARRRVRFIGDPRDRIREDYLRILRFFRFTAEYAAGAPDADGIAACIALADGLDRLSAERVRAEVLRLVASPRATEIAAVMDESGLLKRVLGTDPDVGTFANLVAIEDALERTPEAVLRLAALAALPHGFSVAALTSHLKLSNAEAERLARAVMPDPALAPKAPDREARGFAYRFGNDALSDALLLTWARSGDPPDDARWNGRLAIALRWKPPPLPIRGADLLDAGLAEGPAIGCVVRAFEDWWIANDFPTDEMRLARKLSDLVKANRN